jgi:hypothetical protein
MSLQLSIDDMLEAFERLGYPARIIEIRLYTGRYPQWFTVILKLAAPQTKAGWVEMTA